MVKREDLVESGSELLPRPGVLLVDFGSIGPPPASDLANREVLPRPQAEELHPPSGALPRRLRSFLLTRARLADKRQRPRAVEHSGQSHFIAGQKLGIEPARRLVVALASDASLAPQSDVTGDAVQEGAEAAGLVLADAVENAALAKALDEDLLDDVVQLIDQTRRLPALGEIRPDDRNIAPGKVFAVVFAPCGRPLNQRPAG